MVPVTLYNRMIAPNGYFYNDTTSAREGLEIKGILIQTDTVFSELKIDGISVLDEWNFTGRTITRDIFPAENSVITDYTLATGSVLEIN